MILPHRRWHRRLWLTLVIVLPLLVIASAASRRLPPAVLDPISHPPG